MRKKIIIILCVLGIVAVALGIVFSKKIHDNKNKIEIIDATYACGSGYEKFYEDDIYIYSFPCPKSSSVYVKLDEKNKMLVVDALREEKVTIQELIDAGLDIIQEKK